MPSLVGSEMCIRDSRWTISRLSAEFISMPFCLAVICFGGIDYGGFCRVTSVQPQWRSQLPIFERSPSLMIDFDGVYFTPNDANGSHPLGRHPWMESQRPETMCSLRCLGAIGRQLLGAMVSTPSVSLTLREKALTWCIKYLAPTRVERAATRAQRDFWAPTARE